MRLLKHSRMKLFVRGWSIVLLFVLTTTLMLLFCVGNVKSDTSSCLNFNVFSFWIIAQNPQLLCVEDNCRKAPFQLLSAPKQQIKKKALLLHQNNTKSVKSADKDLNTSPSIHLAVVACGDRLKETMVMIKSAVIISEQPIHVHIFADDELRPKFKQEINKWPAFIHKRLASSIYPITYPEGTVATEWIKLFKPCATQRLFIPYVVPENVTDLILYVDTDILFMRPIEHIWNFFSRFNSSHIAALAPEHEWDRQGWYNRFARHPYYGERGVNSGVMLMKLSKMREIDWADRMIEYHKEYKLKITWGDQDLINIFFHYYPEKLYVYPCHWNFRPDHCMYGLNCKQAEKRGASIIHGNRGVYHNDKQPVFKAVYNVIKSFKFDDDLTTGLLKPLQKEIKAVEKSGYCGANGKAFTLQLERQLKLKSKNCQENMECDPYEPEDFELEAKLQMGARAIKVDDKQQKKESHHIESQFKKKEDKNSQSELNKHDISDSQFDGLTSGLLKKFSDIKESKLLPTLIEHLTRLEDARERHKKVVARPQENVDSALLPQALHEEILGYAQSLRLYNTADDYLKILSTVIDRLKSKQNTKQLDSNKEEMHLVVVACGELLEQPLVMMKSAILFARNFLHFHIFAEDHLQPQFKNALDSWPQNVQSKFKLHIHDIQYPNENAHQWKNLFKKCATQRLFLPSLLADIDSVIYVDTDILFLRPIDDLWNRLKQFNETHIAGLAPEHEDASISWYKRFARHPYYPPLGVNSGVMPMNLTRMREAKWLEHIVPYFHKYRYNTTWGDQDLINIFFHFFPEKLYVFPCDWNYRQDHCMYMHMCKRAEEHGVSILHGARGVYHNDKEPAFRAVYEALREYQFGTGLQKELLPKMRENIAQQKNTNCGKVGMVLTKQLEKQLDLRRKKK